MIGVFQQSNNIDIKNPFPVDKIQYGAFNGPNSTVYLGKSSGHKT